MKARLKPSLQSQCIVTNKQDDFAKQPDESPTGEDVKEYISELLASLQELAKTHNLQYIAEALRSAKDRVGRE